MGTTMTQARVNELILKGIAYEMREAQSKIKWGNKILEYRRKCSAIKCPITDDEVLEIIRKYEAKIEALAKEKFDYMYEQEISMNER